MTKKLPIGYRREGEHERRKDQNRADQEQVLEALQPDIDFCSKCREHTEFALVDEELLSVCCGYPPFEQP